jgi:hypothetical protein
MELAREQEQSAGAGLDGWQPVGRVGSIGGPRTSRRADLYERASRLITLAAIGIAFVACLVTPLLAIGWSHQPFPGFLVDLTLVVNGNNGLGWAGRLAGLDYPQRVTRIGGVAVATSADYNAVLAAREAGQQVTILTVAPDGSTRLFPSIPLEAFPAGDLVRLFWLPYLVGLAYLGIAVWIYRARGNTRPGRALAFFCVSTGLVCLLLFDGSTTHAAPALWTIAMAQVGGALISLALRFPEQWNPVERRVWLLAVPYGVSILLGGWGLLAISSSTHPWAYAAAWGASYRYTALAVVIFLAVMVYRARRGGSSLVRQQARVVLWGSTLAFLPVSLWFVAPLFNLSIAFNGLLFLPGLLIFPLAVAVAIFRYRLMEADALVNRTIVYGVLMAILAGVFTAAVGLSQKLFVAVTGEKSDAAVVITTLIVASGFAPLKKRLEALIGDRLQKATDDTHALKAFGEQVRAFTQMSDASQIAQKLLEQAMGSLHAQSGAVSLTTDGRMRTVQTCGRWTGEAWISLPLEEDGTRYGMLFLGPHQDHKPYSPQEFEALREVGAEVAHAVRLALNSHGSLAVLAQGVDQPRGPASQVSSPTHSPKPA